MGEVWWIPRVAHDFGPFRSFLAYVAVFHWKMFFETFLDAQASLAPTQYPSQSVGWSVRPSVRHTFKFPFYQRLWLLYVKS